MVDSKLLLLKPQLGCVTAAAVPTLPLTVTECRGGGIRGAVEMPVELLYLPPHTHTLYCVHSTFKIQLSGTN